MLLNDYIALNNTITLNALNKLLCSFKLQRKDKYKPKKKLICQFFQLSVIVYFVLANNTKYSNEWFGKEDM